MINEKRQCSICGLMFPRDGKRTVCSIACYEYRKKFVYIYDKKIKICHICGTVITAKDRNSLCSPECAYEAEKQQRKNHYERKKAKRLGAKNSTKNNQRSKHIRTLDKSVEASPEAENGSASVPITNTYPLLSLTCQCRACQNRAKNAGQRR